MGPQRDIFNSWKPPEYVKELTKRYRKLQLVERKITGEQCMTDPLEKQVQAELKKGRSKKKILKALATEENKEDLAWYLNQYPTDAKRKQTLLLNYFLILILLVLTVKKLYFIALMQLNALSVDQFSPLLLIELLVPAINFFFLIKLFRFYRQGYQVVAVLALLALVRSENQIMPDVIGYLIIITLALFLFKHLFPKKENLDTPPDNAFPIQ